MRKNREKQCPQYRVRNYFLFWTNPRQFSADLSRASVYTFWSHLSTAKRTKRFLDICPQRRESCHSASSLTASSQGPFGPASSASGGLQTKPRSNFAFNRTHLDHESTELAKRPFKFTNRIGDLDNWWTESLSCPSRTCISTPLATLTSTQHRFITNPPT